MTRTRVIHAPAKAIHASAKRSAACAALCLLAANLTVGAPAFAQAPAVSSQPATANADVKKAEEAMANEDPTKIVDKPDPATTKDSPNPAVGKQANGMWIDKDGDPTSHISKDGTLDFFTFSGYRRYGANCLVCHGPDGMGSSYAPALVDSLKRLSYTDFLGTVAAGRQNVSNSSNLVMPAFGDNKNVQCYINDIYVYLRARATDQLDRQRPTKHEEKPKDYASAETACIGF